MSTNVNLGAKIRVLNEKIERQERQLERTKAMLGTLKSQFASAVYMCDTVQIHQIGEQYANKYKFLGHIELSIVQYEVERSRAVKMLAETISERIRTDCGVDRETQRIGPKPAEIE